MDSRPIDYQLSHTNLKQYYTMCSERLLGAIEIVRTMISFRKVHVSVTCTWEVPLKRDVSGVLKYGLLRICVQHYRMSQSVVPCYSEFQRVWKVVLCLEEGPYLIYAAHSLRRGLLCCHYGQMRGTFFMTQATVPRMVTS